MGVETRKGPILSADQVESFERDGYLVIDDPCPPGLVDAVGAEFDQRFREEFHPGPRETRDGVLYVTHPLLREGLGYHWQRIMDAWRISDAALAVAKAPTVLAALRELYGREPLAFQTLNFPVGTQQPAHSDSMFFSADPPRFMCGVWLALENMDMDNGPLVYYPGSHKLPMPTVDLIEQGIGEHIDPSSFDDVRALREERNRQYTIYCRKLVEEGGFEPAYGTIRKGQALIWSSNLLHGGAPQKDRNRTRHSQVTHYLFEDTRLKRPIWSEGELVYWDYPAWVRDEVPGSWPDAFRGAVANNIPPGSQLIVAAHSTGGPPKLPSMDVIPFAGAARDGEDPVATLERLRADGAQYLVAPPDGFWVLQMEAPKLQQALEKQYRPVFIDGLICAIYDLG